MVFGRRRTHDAEQVAKTISAGLVAARASQLVAELQEAVVDLRETLRNGNGDSDDA